MNKVTSIGPGELNLSEAYGGTAAPEISHDLQKFLEEDSGPTLEESVHLHLLSMNRHDRLAWLARANRKAGAQRNKALTVRKADK